MNRLEVKIDPQEEHLFKIVSCDLFRPGLKQIGNSLAEILKYFCPQDAETIMIFPSTISRKMKDIRNRLENIIKESTFFQTRTPNVRKGFIYVSESLVPILSLPTPYKPGTCDILFILPYQPVTVLTIVENDISDDHRKYNVSIARGTIGALGKFLNESVYVVCGVLQLESLNSNEFDHRMDGFRTQAQLFVPPRSLTMSPTKFEKVMSAFLAASALTSSVMREGEEGRFLKFLTKDQCQVLLENLDKAEVLVECVPKSGATTLMLEVARRLSLLEDTAIVCESQEYDAIRHQFPSTFSWQEEPSTSGVRNLVCDRNAVHQPRGKCWKFSKINQDEQDTNDASGTVSHVADTETREQTSIQDDLIHKFRKLTGDTSLRRIHVQDSSVKSDEARHSSNEQFVPEETDKELTLIHEIRKNKKHIAQLQARAAYMEEEQAKRSQLEEKLDHSKQDPTSRKRKVDEQPELEPKEKRLKSTDYPQYPERNYTKRLVNAQNGTGSGHAFKELLKKVKVEDDKQMKRFSQKIGKLERDIGNIVYIVGEIDTIKSVPVVCPAIQFDKESANSNVCHVTEDGCLTNVKPKTESRNRFRKYRGTRGSIWFPPLQDSLVPVLPNYWETHIHGWLKKRVLVWRTFFEISLVEESNLDAKYMSSNQDRSWAVTMADCTIHEGLCTKVYEKGQLIKCIPSPTTNETNTVETQRFGTIVDIKKGKIAFLDVGRLRVIHCFKVSLRERAFPLFGMWSYPDDYTVIMEVLGGRQIEMTDDKLRLINTALMTKHEN